MGVITMCWKPSRQMSGGCAVRGRSSRAPSAVLGFSGADVTQGGGHGAAGSCEDVLRKAVTARSVRPPLCLSRGRPPPETRSGQGLIRLR